MRLRGRRFRDGDAPSKPLPRGLVRAFALAAAAACGALAQAAGLAAVHGETDGQAFLDRIARDGVASQATVLSVQEIVEGSGDRRKRRCIVTYAYPTEQLGAQVTDSYRGLGRCALARGDVFGVTYLPDDLRRHVREVGPQPIGAAAAKVLRYASLGLWGACLWALTFAATGRSPWRWLGLVAFKK
ncbi:MAG: hypothetical protein AAGI51_01540 [Pseudomonadota bacterium]